MASAAWVEACLLGRRERQRQALTELAEQVGGARGGDLVIAACDRVREALEVDGVFVLEPAGRQGELSLRGASGWCPLEGTWSRLEGHDPAGSVVELTGSVATPRFALAAPFQLGDAHHGLLVACASRPSAFDADDHDFLRSAAELVAGGLAPRPMPEPTRAPAAEDLHVSSELRWLADALPHIVFAARRDGLPYCNQLGLDYLGCSQRDLERPWAWLHHVHPADRLRATRAWRDALSGDRTYRCDLRLRRASDGAYLWHTVHASPVPGDDGAPTQWFGTCTDVHGRRVAEEALQESWRAQRRQVAELEAICESLPVGISLHGTDYRFRTINSTLAELNGLPRESHIGRRCEELFPELADRVHPLIEQVLTTGEAVRDVEIHERTDDGDRIWQVSYAPVCSDEEDPLIGVSCVVQDITERRSSEERLRASEARLRRVIESSPVPTVVADSSGAVHHLSRSFAEVTGLDRSELTTVSALLNHLFRDRADEMREVVLERSWDPARREPIEVEIWSADGERRTMMFSSAPLGESADGLELWMCAAMDITARQRAEEALAAADQQKNHFLALLGHELRNPLGVIRSAISLLDQVAPAPPALDRAREILRRQTSHVARLVDGLLDVSRIVRGKLELELEAIDLVRVLEEVLRDRAPQLQGRGLTLEQGLPDEPCWVRGDHSRLVQVFDNLLSNAIKFTPSGGTVTVALTRRAELLHVEVRDTGVGLAHGSAAELFEPFRQAVRSRNRTAGGLGLGLALVRGVVELHGGEVWAHSEGPGRGATLSVDLPRWHAPARSSEVPRPRGRARRILLVEDNRDHAELLRDLLRAMGHEVDLAHDASEALARAEAQPPEVILCDLGLPGALSGYDLAAAVRADRRLDDVVLIALTGYGSADDRRESESAGFRAHLTKPIDLEAIEEALAALDAG